jgi:hypothetical protein
MSKTAEECKKEAMARINRMRASARDPELTKAMNRIGAALERLADAYLYVNQQEDEPSFEGQSLSDRGHL